MTDLQILTLAYHDFFPGCMCVSVWQWVWNRQNPRLKITVQQLLFLVERDRKIVFCGEKSSSADVLLREIPPLVTTGGMRNLSVKLVGQASSSAARVVCSFFFDWCLEGWYLCWFPGEKGEIWNQAASTGFVFCSKGWVALCGKESWPWWQRSLNSGKEHNSILCVWKMVFFVMVIISSCYFGGIQSVVSVLIISIWFSLYTSIFPYFFLYFSYLNQIIYFSFFPCYQNGRVYYLGGISRS